MPKYSITKASFGVGRTSRISNLGLIRRLEEYIGYVRFIQRTWKSSTLWFRGVAESKQRLIPSLFRDGVNVEKGDSAFREFVRRGLTFSNAPAAVDTFGWMQLAQHHGLPTRLLDWTESSFVAAYFAVRSIQMADTASVWVLDPKWLNTMAIGVDHAVGPEHLAIEGGSYASDAVPHRELPLAVLPPHTVARLAAQRGCFTHHGTARNGFDLAYRRGLAPDAESRVFGKQVPRLVQLRFNNQAVQRIASDLNTGGITETGMFPDFDGLARELSATFYLRKSPTRSERLSERS